MHQSHQADEHKLIGTMRRPSERKAALPGQESYLHGFDSRFPNPPQDRSPWQIRIGKRSIARIESECTEARMRSRGDVLLFNRSRAQ